MTSRGGTEKKEEFMSRRDKETLLKKWSNLYVVKDFPPCDPGEQFIAYQFLAWYKGKRIYKKAGTFIYLGHDEEQWWDLYGPTVYARRPGPKLGCGWDGVFMCVMESNGFVLDEECKYGLRIIEGRT